MRDETANLVYPVLRLGLELRERLRRGEQPVFEVAQRQFLDMLRAVAKAHPAEKPPPPIAGADNPEPPEPYLGIGYPLACWLDEVFVLDSPWATAWNERKMEVTFYGTNERAWAFWRQARLAEDRSDDDLEVFFLCAMLGFRGEWVDDPEPLKAWVIATRTRLVKALGGEWSPPPELYPPASVPPRRGRAKLRRMALVGMLVFLLAVPYVVLLIGRQLG